MERNAAIFRAWRCLDQKTDGRLNQAILPTMASLGLLLTACTRPLETSNHRGNLPSNLNQTPPKPEFSLPIYGLSYFTSGPHDSSLRGGIRDAIDITPINSGSCEDGERRVLAEPLVIASASGVIKTVGDENNPNDPHHSIVEIATDRGLTSGLMHILRTRVEVGDRVEAGKTVIGQLACATPPGGRIAGHHVHKYLRNARGEQIPIDGHTISGYIIREGVKENEGSMTKHGEEVRIANEVYCGPNPEIISGSSCGGQRNDLYNFKDPLETAYVLSKYNQLNPAELQRRISLGFQNNTVTLVPPPPNAKPSVVAETFLRAVANRQLQTAQSFFAPDKPNLSWYAMFPVDGWLAYDALTRARGHGYTGNNDMTPDLINCAAQSYSLVERTEDQWRKTVTFRFQESCIASWHALGGFDTFRVEESLADKFMVVLEEANSRWFVTPNVEVNRKHFFSGIVR